MSIKPTLLTVSQINRQIRHLLETDVGKVYVEGEVSNLMQPASGHLYFTLKDNWAQLRCVFFKNRHRHNCKMTNGQQIVVNGTPGLYEARGDYQLIIEDISDAGFGKLHQQFEALKTKLTAEGLFASQHKKKLPLFPNTIGIISSSTGAAIRDVLITLERRYPYATVLIYPCEVQGNQAPLQLKKALLLAEKEKRADVLILARGGGSFEDLWSFNDEALARTIFASSLPIVTGIGHETDFTIADFVSDLRAATPTAAAEATSPDAAKLLALLSQYADGFHNAIKQLLKQTSLRLAHQQQKMSSPGRLILSHWQTLDYLQRRLFNAVTKIIRVRHHQIQLFISKLETANPGINIKQQLAYLTTLDKMLKHHMQARLNMLMQFLATKAATLQAVSPLSTLERGYAIATLNDNILFSHKQVNKDDLIQVRLFKGRLTCTILTSGDE